MSDIDAAPIARADGGLLEREEELRTLAGVVDASRSGSGRLLLIEGEAGIGKTALLSHATNVAAAAGVEVVSARGLELERENALGVVRQFAETVLRGADERRRERLLQGAARLLPTALTPREPGGGRPAVDAAFTLSHGFYWLIANLTEGAPVMLALDDAQFADRSSLQCLAYLAARRSELPLLLALTVRSGEPGADELLDYVRVAPDATILAPSALSAVAVANLTSARLGDVDDEFASACARVSGGNPFLLRELLSELAAVGIAPTADNAARVDRASPDAVRRAVLRRLGRLGTDATALAHAVAVLERATIAQAGELAALDSAATIDAADRLAAAGVLGTAPLAFVHPLLRRSVYEEIPPASRADAHRRAALLLARAGAPMAAVGAQLLRAAPSGSAEVVELLRRAASAAIAGGDSSSATTLLRRALAEPPAPNSRPLVLAELGQVEALAHDLAAAEHLREALALSEDPAARVAIACALGELLVWSGGHSVEAYDLLSGLLQELGEDAPPQLRAPVETLRVATASVDARLAPRVAPLLPGLRDLADRAGPDGRGLKLFEACWEAQTQTGGDGWRQRLDEGLDGGAFVREHTGASPIVIYATIVLVLADEVIRAESLLAEIREDAGSRGSIVSHLVQFVWEAFLWMRCGELRAATSDARSALSLARRLDAGWVELWLVACLGEALREQGDLDAASELVENAEIDQGIGTAAALHALVARARVRLARGERETGLADLRLAGANMIVNNPSFVPWRPELAVALASSDPAEARVLADESLKRAQLLGQPRGLGVALRAHGRVAEGEAALTSLEQSVAVLRNSPAKLELAHSLTYYGATLRRQGNRRAARDPLREALVLAQRCGADALAARVREELKVAGARPRRAELSGPASLTPSERRVAELVAAGLQNREIAQALFVTTKTVGTHLTHIYQKLDLAGPEARDQLAGQISGGVPDALLAPAGHDHYRAERRQ